MMPWTLAARLCTQICCFLYPAYASFRALSLSNDHPHAPDAGGSLERWLMYWTVVGCWVAVESTVGWLFNWLPFYSVAKFGFFLYLSLPQSEGSTYIFREHLEPLFREHEAELDSFLRSLRGRASLALSGSLGWIWQWIASQLGGASGQGHDAAAQGYDMNHQYPTGIQQPPSLQDPASGAAQQAFGFMARYAGQYLPVALSALQSAASAARSGGNRSTASAEGIDPVIASLVPQTMSMPTPRPNVEQTDTYLRSRTYLAAQGSPTPASRNRGSTSALSARNVSMPSGSLSQRSSSESVNTRSSGDGGGGSGRNSSSGSRIEMSSYDQIGRDEARDAPVGTERPGMEKRRSSWFGHWGGGSPGEKSKAE